MIFIIKAFEMVRDFYYGLFYQSWINSYDFREALDDICFTINSRYEDLYLFYKDKGHYAIFLIVSGGEIQFVMNYIYDIGEKYKLDTEEKLKIFLENS